MRMLDRVALTAALLVPVVAAPAAAQRYRADFGVNGGYSWYSNALSSDMTGLPDDKVRLEAGPLLGSQLTFWLTPRIGIRANGTYADRDLITDESTLINHVNLWSGSGDLMFRFRAPNEEWSGSEFLPYLALGLGAKWANPAGDNFTCTDVGGGSSISCTPFSTGTGTSINDFAMGDKKASLMGLVGLGTDIRLAPSFALRLEVSDRIWKPQLYAADIPATGTNVALTDGETRVSKTVHEVGAQLGLHFLMGLSRPEVVAVAPAPLPPPPPPPAQPAQPTEEAVQVCVVDPTAPNGVRMQDALFLPATNDTVVVMNGNRVPLRQSVGNIQVARTADWYVRGEPLTLTVGPRKLQYLTYQGATQIPADQLAFLGTINGYPVYANSAEVADLNTQLTQLRTTQNSSDLGTILVSHNDVVGNLENVKLLYVPLEPTGCVFQTVQLLEQVRKSK